MLRRHETIASWPARHFREALPPPAEGPDELRDGGDNGGGAGDDCGVKVGHGGLRFVEGLTFLRPRFRQRGP